MSNKPIESYYAGNIEVAIWQNQGEDSKIFHSVTAKRTYMDGNGEWKDAGTIHLLPQQIPDLMLALSKSHEHLRMGMRQKRRQQANPAGNGQPDLDSQSAGQSESTSNDTPPEVTEGELVGVDTGNHEEGFVGKVSQQRGGGRRSR